MTGKIFDSIRVAGLFALLFGIGMQHEWVIAVSICAITAAMLLKDIWLRKD